MKRYVTTKTARLYENKSGNKFHMVLIFGDEVEVNGATENGRRQAKFRGRIGWIKVAQVGTSPALQIFYLDVGQGDSAFIIAPNGKKILVDGGVDHRAIGFLIWLFRLDNPQNTLDIDLLVLSHADQDHIKGLVPIVSHPQIRVHEVVHNGIATFRSSAGYDQRSGDLDGNHLVTWHDSLAELEPDELSNDFKKWRDAIVNANVPVYRVVDTESETIDINDAEIGIELLGPNYETLPDGTAGLRWFKDHAHTINGHSIAFRLDHGDVRFLFSGDLNVEGSRYLLEIPGWREKLDAHVFKSPHHGSHEYYSPFFEAVRPQVSVVSSGDSPDHGHPRAEFLGALGLAGRTKTPLIFSTEIAATFVDSGETLEEIDVELDDIDDFSSAESNVVARKLFKQSLPGIINVRSDGRNLYAARRVSAGYWWEAYGPIAPAPYPSLFEPV